jgi:hypothetical protein
VPARDDPVLANLLAETALQRLFQHGVVVRLAVRHRDGHLLDVDDQHLLAQRKREQILGQVS